MSTPTDLFNHNMNTIHWITQHQKNWEKRSRKLVCIANWLFFSWLLGVILSLCTDTPLVVCYPLMLVWPAAWLYNAWTTMKNLRSFDKECKRRISATK